MTLGSLFDGSGGFPLAGVLNGVEPVWASEVEPFPIRVTTRRMPGVRHYGDIAEMDGGEVEPVDVITFGSPCQDLSVAGKRAGLEGARSGLFHEAVRVVKEMRRATNGEKPRFIVWENVTGALSSSGGEDFRTVIEEICGIADPSVRVPRPAESWPGAGGVVADGWSLAWRVLDAQFWGVPQRRKRVFLVADFGGERASEILFEPERVPRDTPPGVRAGEEAPGDSEGGAGAPGGGLTGAPVVLSDQGGERMGVSVGLSPTLRSESHGHQPLVVGSAGFIGKASPRARGVGYKEEQSPTLRAGLLPDVMMLDNHPVDGRLRIEKDGKTPTLTSRMGTGGNNVPLVMKPDGHGPACAMATGGFAQPSMDVAPTLTSGMRRNPINVVRAGGQSGAAAADGIPFTQNQRDEVRILGEKTGALSAYPGAKQQTYVLQGNPPAPDKDGHHVCAMYSGGFARPSMDVAPTLISGIRKDPVNVVCARNKECLDNNSVPLARRDYKSPPYVAYAADAQVIRRLTPLECARLQGFPDSWCADLGTDNPTEDEMEFWRGVFRTKRRLSGSPSDSVSDKHIAKWLRDPRTDSAEYKMWGNGVALPCVGFVLSRVVEMAAGGRGVWPEVPLDADRAQLRFGFDGAEEDGE